MNINTINNIMDEYEKILDECDKNDLNTDYLFSMINKIASNYKNIDSILNVTYQNGVISQGICLITDWEPGALVFQSEDGKLLRIRVILEDEYNKFMLDNQEVLYPNIPELPEE